jgi:UDP-N-acetylglucosamine 2-epimerase
MLSLLAEKDKIISEIKTHKDEILKLKNQINLENQQIEKEQTVDLGISRLQDEIDKHNIKLGKIEIIPLLGYKEYLETVYNCRFIISDSGTGQEEPALLETPVIVPRDFTERPQSYTNNCSKKLNAEILNYNEIFEWFESIENGSLEINSKWLGEGNTSKLIINKIINFLS